MVHPLSRLFNSTLYGLWLAIVKHVRDPALDFPDGLISANTQLHECADARGEPCTFNGSVVVPAPRETVATAQTQPWHI